MTTEKEALEREAMKAVANRFDNPVYVLLMVGEIWEVWTDFEKAYEKYLKDDDMKMEITELKGKTEQ